MFDDFRLTSYLVDSIPYIEPLHWNRKKIIRFNSPEQAYKWVIWLRSSGNAAISDVIEEVEYQSCQQLRLKDDFDDTDWDMLNVQKALDISIALRKGLADIKFKCARCGKIENYENSCTIVEKTLAGTSSRVISRGLTGGSVTREITHSYNVAHLQVCPKCAEIDRKKKRNKKIKNILIWIGVALALAVYILCDIYC